MKRGYIECSIVIILVITGMGMTSKKANEIPTPAKDFTVDIIDREGFHTEGHQVSIDGEVFISVRRGAASFYIAFDKIQDIQFGDIDKDWIKTTILLNDTDEPLSGEVDGLLPCYGETSFGQFEIRMKNIQKITFKGMTPKE
ncbi:hypothetical protein JW905_18410 [bacterium]|nr:hypothetical protein [candidate division CSSED10-310 bacterium]